MNFSVGDAIYHYEINGEGPPIVLLHGFTGTHATWSNFVSTWQTEFQLITIDLPGHGQTVTETPRTMESCCNDLQQLFDYLGLKTFHLVGYSMGGRIALSFAMLYPAYISTLILESASPGLQTEDERKQRLINDEKLAQRLESKGIKPFVDFWENIPLFASQRKLSKNTLQMIREERLSQSELGLSESLRRMGTGIQPSWWAKLDRITQPVLLIVGELDEKFVKINKEIKEAIAHADLVIVKNVGHAIHVEEPEKFGKLVIDFILNDSQGGF